MLKFIYLFVCFYICVFWYPAVDIMLLLKQYHPCVNISKAVILSSSYHS